MTTSVTDLAREILAANRYAVIATATPDGEPWASPVYFVSQGLDALLWLSRPESQHSQLIAANERVAVTVFDSGVAFGKASGFYARATAGFCPEDELPGCLAVFSERSRERGFPTWQPEEVSGDAPLRLYRARISAAWLLPAGDGPERRIPVSALAEGE